MHKNHERLWVALALSLGVSAVACAGTIQCGSTGHQYNYCSVYTGNAVRMVNQMSSSPCRQGETWGYDGRGIWVDHGCRAEFEYGYGNGGYRPQGGHHDRNSDVIAGVAAVAILAALAGSDHSHSHTQYQGGSNHGGYQNGGGAVVPGWAVGSFSGGDTASGSDISLAINSNGYVDGYYGHSRLEGQFAGNSVWLGSRRYSVGRTGNGMRLTANDDPSMVIFLYRD